jgi:hypothetical protein
VSITAQAVAQGIALIKTAIANEFNSARLATFAAEGVCAIEWVSVIDEATTDICLRTRWQAVVDARRPKRLRELPPHQRS